MNLTLVEIPLSYPGQCWNCGSPGRDGRRFLDTGKNVKKFGRAIICELCIKEIVKLFGFGEVDFLEVKIESLEKKNMELVDENLRLRTAFDTLDSIKSVLASPTPEKESNKSSIGKAKPTTSKSKPRLTKPVDESGSEDILSDVEDLF